MNASEEEREQQSCHKAAGVCAAYTHDRDSVFKIAGMRCSSLIITGCLVFYHLHIAPEAEALLPHAGPPILALVSGQSTLQPDISHFKPNAENRCLVYHASFLTDLTLPVTDCTVNSSNLSV